METRHAPSPLMDRWWSAIGRGRRCAGPRPGGAFGLAIFLAFLAAAWALGISPDGSIVVGQSDSSTGFQAFRWTAADGMISIGGSVALDASNDGTLVGYDGVEAVVWDETNVMRAVQDVLVGLGLDLTGWSLLRATGISDDGRTIVGAGTNPAGRSEAWIAVIPEPSSILLLGAGLTALVSLRRRGVAARPG